MVILYVDVVSDLLLKVEGKLLLVKKIFYIFRILSIGFCYFKNYFKLEEIDFRFFFIVIIESS